MNPICLNCNVEMRCFKNGVSVVHELNLRWRKSGDIFQCPSCGAKIVAQISKEGYASDADPDVIVITAP